MRDPKTVYSTIFILSFVVLIEIMWTELKTHLKIQRTHRPVPKEMTPVPVLSNSWKATMKRASGAHNTDSNARNSWNEIRLPLWVYMWCKRKKKDILLNTKTWKTSEWSQGKDQFTKITYTHKTNIKVNEITYGWQIKSFSYLGKKSTFSTDLNTKSHDQ